MSSTNQGPAQTLSPNLSPVSFGLDGNGVPVFYAGGSPAANSDFLGAFAWTSLPAAASYAGYRARVTDYGVNLMVISDGTRWVPNGVQTLGRSAVASSVTGTTSETALATITVPAGLLGVNGGVRVWTAWSMTNSANNKTPRARLGGIGGTAYLAFPLTTSAGFSDVRRIRNRGAANSQVGGISVTAGSSLSSSGGTPPTSAIDTTANVDLVLSGQLALGTETLTLEEYTVEVLA